MLVRTLSYTVLGWWSSQCNKARKRSGKTQPFNYQNLKYLDTKCCRGCIATVTLTGCWWECEMVQPLWKIVCQFFKN